jgi:hypothetical protein
MNTRMGGLDFIGTYSWANDQKRQPQGLPNHFYRLDLSMMSFGDRCWHPIVRDNVWLLKTCVWHRPQAPKSPFTWPIAETLSLDNAMLFSESWTQPIISWGGDWISHIPISFSAFENWISVLLTDLGQTTTSLYGLCFPLQEIILEIATQEKKMIQDLPMKGAEWYHFMTTVSRVTSCPTPSH